jgi:hypothetical protein
VTCAVPLPADTLAVIRAADTTVNDDAATTPNRTALAPMNPLPVTLTTEPTGPDEGASATTTGKTKPFMPFPYELDSL